MARDYDENAWFNRLKVGVGQIKTSTGDFPGNVEKVLNAIKKAEELGCNLVVFPEMCLAGCPAHDLLQRPDFVQGQISAMRDVASRVGRIIVLLGFVSRKKEDRIEYLHNAAALCFDGKVLRVIEKSSIGEHSGLEERHYMTKGELAPPVRINRVAVGVLVGDDVLRPGTCEQLAEQGAHVIVAPIASPFRIGATDSRISRIAERADEASVNLLVVNRVGGQDELVFDGASFAVDDYGERIWQAPQFEEGLFVVEVHDCGLSKAIVGLSGGIDSALVAALAKDALGPENVLGLLMPSGITSKESTDYAESLASNLSIKTESVPIQPILDTYIGSLSGHFVGKEPDVTEQNLHARIRGDILMAFSNKLGHLVLCTGNRSEGSTGYATLYGDMAGGFCPLADVPKTLVYSLAGHINSRTGQEVIPKTIIDREPTAELRPNQTDAESLGPYKQLDPILEAHLDRGLGIREIVDSGLPEEATRDALRRFYCSQHKRHQAAPGPRIVSARTSSEVRLPINSHFDAWFKFSE